ncbi:MAG TPA: hypothetical protein VMB05_00510 [Solirubrobacteraceae bacterium]|nr:hypothetical protein [Solirubrobacteraceae bacterium]
MIQPRIAVALVALALLAATGCSAQGSRPSAVRSCNGSAVLCERRLDQVFFAGTHNSFAASEEPGWYFANQTFPISRQLQGGIRALLIDVHFGVYDPTNGRVRTDLTAEGSDRNKVAEQVPASALRVAERVAGGIGLGDLSGTPEPYLCHTLCELGAEPLERELVAIRDFLRAHPDQVVLVIVEDYVPPATIEESFKNAGLLDYVATLERHAPLPTLGELISSKRRLLVFAEEKGGKPSWYMPAFSFMQDTPLGALHPGELSCARYRGAEGDPMLLINHWIPPFPPSITMNALIGRSPFLRARVERCTRDRHIGGAIVAVDFYQRTAVVEVTRALNERR